MHPSLCFKATEFKGVFLEIFHRGLPALTTATHGCVSLSLWVFWDGLTRLTLMLNGCFLKLSQSISSDCVPEMLLTPFFLIHCEDGGRNMDRVPFSFYYIYFCFVFWQNHYICLLSDDLCVFEYLKWDSDFLIALRASLKLPCAYLNCAFTYLQGGYCFFKHSGDFVMVVIMSSELRPLQQWSVRRLGWTV